MTIVYYDIETQTGKICCSQCKLVQRFSGVEIRPVPETGMVAPAFGVPDIMAFFNDQYLEATDEKLLEATAQT